MLHNTSSKTAVNLHTAAILLNLSNSAEELKIAFTHKSHHLKQIIIVLTQKSTKKYFADVMV